MALLQTLVTYIIIFAILVFFHELGHFLIAKAFRMRVEEFAFGFGPRVVRVASDGQTDYTIRAIPLGGFVRIAGMEVEDAVESRLTGGRPDASDKDHGFETTNAHALEQESAEVSGAVTDGFNDRPVYQRFGVILAGPVFSFLLGWFALCMIGVAYGLPVPGQKAPFFKVGEAIPDKPAARAGLSTGDIVTGIPGNDNADNDAVYNAIMGSPGKPLRLVVKSPSGTTRPVTVTPNPETDPQTGKTVGKIGVLIDPGPVKLQRASLAESFRYGNDFTLGWVQLVSNAFKTGGIKDNVGGPIAMIKQTNKARQMGGPAPLALLGQFSLSLGLFNLFPIPILDGGHLVLLTLEAVRRRKLTRVQTERVLMTGLAVLAAFFVLVMFKDVRGLINK